MSKYIYEIYTDSSFHGKKWQFPTDCLQNKVDNIPDGNVLISDYFSQLPIMVDILINQFGEEKFEAYKYSYSLDFVHEPIVCICPIKVYFELTGQEKTIEDVREIVKKQLAKFTLIESKPLF